MPWAAIFSRHLASIRVQGAWLTPLRGNVGVQTPRAARSPKRFAAATCSRSHLPSSILRVAQCQQLHVHVS